MYINTTPYVYNTHFILQNHHMLACLLDGNILGTCWEPIGNLKGNMLGTKEKWKKILPPAPTENYF
jgi:hypothetical protein